MEKFIYKLVNVIEILISFGKKNNYPKNSEENLDIVLSDNDLPRSFRIHDPDFLSFTRPAAIRKV